MSSTLPQSTYNTLIQRSIDLLNLYRRAASSCEPGLKVILDENAQTLDAMITDLQTQLRASGGNPSSAGTLRGALRRHIAGSLNRVASHRDVAWIRELSDGESGLLRAFETVVSQLPPESALALRRQLPRLNNIHLDMDNLAGTAL
ncbi:PA2169 family four-helix-bundle protein [Rhodanobacter sp. BL-MT-08]